MKKNIDYMNLDSSLAQWLCGKLKASAEEVRGAGELYDAVKKLLEGRSSSLILEMGEDGGRTSNDQITCGQITIYPAARKVVKANEEISLTPKEFDILYFLAENRGEVFTKEQIYNAVWSEEYLLDDSNIMAFIRKLRKKIEPNPDAPQYILTIWGVGYKFSDEV